MYNDFTNRGHLDKKLDMIIGANKANVNRKAMLKISVWVFQHFYINKIKAHPFLIPSQYISRVAKYHKKSSQYLAMFLMPNLLSELSLSSTRSHDTVE